MKSSGAVRAARRLYDGAPPVIPHDPFGADLQQLPRHLRDRGGRGRVRPGLSPRRHRERPTPPPDAGNATCRDWTKASSSKTSSWASGRICEPGGRLYDGAPPTIPHKILMRENCSACHAGPGARAEILTTHPERTRCRQCHVPVTTRDGILSYGRSPPRRHRRGHERIAGYHPPGC